MNIQNIGTQNPNFGMALYIEGSAHPVIKRQASKIGKKAYSRFWEKIRDIGDAQANNTDADIFVRKCRHRSALIAEVIDNSENPLKKIKYSQPLLFKNGRLKFLEKAGGTADKLKDMTWRLNKYKTPVKTDDIAENQAQILN